MFEYCTRTLGYSEGAAYLRIYAGRLAREYPEILDLLRSRRLHLTAVRTVGPHLSPGNYRDLLSQSLSKTERELKFLVATVAPKPEPLEVIRRLPQPQLPAPPRPEEPPDTPAPAGASAPPREEPLRIETPRARVEPLTASRVRFAFTGSGDFLRKIERVRQLLHRRYPAGALEDIFSATVDCFLESRDPALKERSARPRATNPRSRRVPQWVKDIVYRRDGGRCAFESPEGLRCEEGGGLEYDHIMPWARGGPSNDPANIRLLCRAHNALTAEQAFGRVAIRRRNK